MKSSSCLIMLMIFGTLTLAIWASNDPSSSAEITDERSFQTLPGEKRSRFHAGSRYGRSQGGGDSSGGVDAMNVNVVSRNNNRFFSGSRYGKRSDELPQPVAEPESFRMYGSEFAPGTLLTCKYTGVKEFFRCKRFVDDYMPMSDAANGFTVA